LEVVEEEELAWQLAKLIESRGADNDVAGAAAAHADDEAANLVIATSLETQDQKQRPVTQTLQTLQAQRTHQQPHQTDNKNKV